MKGTMAGAVLLLTLAALVLVGCSPPARSARSEPLSTEDEAALSRARKIGREIFIHDAANARATDVLRATPIDPRAAGAVGYLELPDGEGLRVVWVTNDGAVIAEVKVGSFPFRAPMLARRLDPPEPLQGDDLDRWRARLVALAQPLHLCPTIYNPVVLSGALDGASGFYVYLLSATTNPRAYVLAGHVLVKVAADGQATVVPLSKSCLVLEPKPEEAANLVALSLGTPLGDYPTEAHAYTSLLYRKTVYVYTASNDRLWKFDPPLQR